MHCYAVSVEWGQTPSEFCDMKNRFLSMLLCLGAGLINAAAASQPSHPLQSISQTARQWLSASLNEFDGRTEFSIGNLDPRLKLAPCDQALQGFASPGSRLPQISTVGVRCTGAAAWTVYVPVTVTAYREVVVAKRPLARGTRIAEEDLAVEDREVSQLRGVFLTRKADAIGLELDQSITAGALLDRDQLRKARIVKRGQNVVLFSAHGPLQVTAPGEALADGAMDDIIRVRNALSRRVIQGRIRDGGKVEVIF